MLVFDITLMWYTLHSGFLQVFVLQVTQKDSTGVFCIMLQVTLRDYADFVCVRITGYTQEFYRCFVSGYTEEFYMCFVSGYTQGFYRCYRLHSGILQMCVLQVTLRVSTGVLCMCYRLH